MRNILLALWVLLVGLTVGPLLGALLFALAYVGVEFAIGGGSAGVLSVSQLPEMLFARFLVALPTLGGCVTVGSLGLAALVLVRGPVGYRAAFIAGALVSVVAGPLLFLWLSGQAFSLVPAQAALNVVGYIALALMTGIGSVGVRALSRRFGLFRPREA